MASRPMSLSHVCAVSVSATILRLLLVPNLANAIGWPVVQYLYNEKKEAGLVTALLILYFFFFILSLITYFRTFFAVKFNAGQVPLSDPRAKHSRRRTKDRGRNSRRERDIEAQPYSSSADSNPDNPGLEEFYSKDVFMCQADGRPRYCTECKQYKPDRAHHSREMGRCYRKMDHYCPWVGGMVSETCKCLYHEPEALADFRKHSSSLHSSPCTAPCTVPWCSQHAFIAW